MIKPIGLTNFSVLNRTQNAQKASKIQEYNNVEFNSKNYSSAIKSLAMSNISFKGIKDLVKDKGQFDDVKQKAEIAKAISQEAYDKMSSKMEQIQEDVDYFLNIPNIFGTASPVEFTYYDKFGLREGRVDFVKDENGNVTAIKIKDNKNITGELTLKTSNGNDYEPDKFVESFEDGSKNIAIFENGRIKEYQDGYIQGSDYEFYSYLVRTSMDKIFSIKSLVTKGNIKDETFTTTSFISYYNNDGSLSRHITSLRESDKAPIVKSQKDMFYFEDGKISQYTKDTTYGKYGDVFVGLTNSFRKGGYVFVAENSRY